MEITAIESIPLAYQLGDGRGYGSSRGTFNQRQTVLVRVETTDGVVGWGEASYGPPETIATLVEEYLAEQVIGMDPFRVRSFGEETYSKPYHYSGQGVFQTAVSAIDIALWDALGKQLERPVYQLLGGPNRTEVTPYASTMYVTQWDQDPAEPIEAAVQNGFEAAKIKIGRGVEDDRYRVKTAREILGNDAKLMVDFNGNYTPKQVLRTLEAVEPYDVHWIEEPVPPENHSGYRKLQQYIDIPITAGEAAFSRFDFKRLIDEQLVDIVQPDIAKCGGISEAMFVGRLATTENVPVSPHVWTGPVGIAASLHVAAALPTYPHATNEPEPFLFECDRGENALREELSTTTIDPTGGSLSVPDSPGLGVEIDENAVERYRIE